MEKISKECVVARQLIINSNKFNTKTRIRLRKKLNKNLDDMINGVSEIEKSISNLPIKTFKKYNLGIIKTIADGKIKKLKEEDKKMDLIQFD